MVRGETNAGRGFCSRLSGTGPVTVLSSAGKGPSMGGVGGGSMP